MNSRPLSDSDVYETYADHFGYCEIAFYLGFTWRGHIFVPTCIGIPVPAQAGCHHIWSVGRRPDFKSNLIKISDAAHDLVHSGKRGEAISIRLLAHLAKLRKRSELGDPSEFTLAEISLASGRASILPWVESQSFGTVHLREAQEELVERLRKLELEAM